MTHVTTDSSFYTDFVPGAWADNDSIFVKLSLHEKKGFVMIGTEPSYECTGNITFEDMGLTGFGASIGSVGPLESHPCVDNDVSFRHNNKIPGSGKGI